MLPKPSCQFVLGQHPCGEALHRRHGIRRCEGQLDTVENEEGSRNYPGRTLVPIGERMISRQGKCMCRRQLAKIIFAVFPLIARPCERRFQGARIADTARTSMFGKLAIVDRKRKLAIQPHRFETDRHEVLLREFA